MLLIEGPDIIGKTTLVNRLCNEARWLKREKFGMAESTCMVEECRKRIKPRTVFDRCWISEIMYGTSARDGSNVDQFQAQECLDMANRAGLYLVVVVAEPATYEAILSRQWASRSDIEEYRREQCITANRAYFDTFVTKESIGDDRGVFPIPEPDELYVMRQGTLWPSSDDTLSRRIIRSYKLRQKNPRRRQELI